MIASGAEPLTFGIKGVKEHAFFLREVTHAQEIRKRLLLNLMLCESPGEFLHTFSKEKNCMDCNEYHKDGFVITYLVII